MTPEQEQRISLAGEIEVAVRRVPGVQSVSRSGSLASNLVGRAAEALGLRDGDEPLVVVDRGGDRVGVEVSIAVEVAASAADTVRAVHAAVAAMLEAEGLEASGIRLTVVHVHE